MLRENITIVLLLWYVADPNSVYVYKHCFQIIEKKNPGELMENLLFLVFLP